MTTFTSPILVSDWLKYEAGSEFSRDLGVVASGSGAVASGTVMAIVTTSGKYVPAATGTTDGSQTAVGVLVFPVDATSADKPAVIVARHAIVSHLGITYGSTITDATHRAVANGQLKAAGILVREGA
jgi:hypothetical protein